ncbi:MAG: hypothetical protein FWG13_03640 [Leptospirales bacterium]|nr:hypothetical protein [Leptospirales bacterium]
MNKTLTLNIDQNVVDNQPLGSITKQLAGIIKLEETTNYKEILADTLLDYTEWRKNNLCVGMSVEEISKAAMGIHSQEKNSRQQSK